jgi:spermidine synthase
MYGSAFRLRPKAGMAAQVRDVMMSDPRRPKVMVNAYLLTEDKAGDIWGFAVFADEKAYRDNAADPAQDAQYQKFRALLASDPEWHDGSIEQRPV